MEKTLTVREARAQKNAPYQRAVLQNGRGEKAQPIPEQLALKSEFPTNTAPSEYSIGVGDTLTFSTLIENNRSSENRIDDWPKQLVS